MTVRATNKSARRLQKNKKMIPMTKAILPKHQKVKRVTTILMNKMKDPSSQKMIQWPEMMMKIYLRVNVEDVRQVVKVPKCVIQHIIPNLMK